MSLSEHRENLASLSEEDVILYGSFVEGGHRKESDVDIAVLAYTEDLDEMKRMKLSLIPLIPEEYDLQIFESLPTLVKASILHNYEVLFGNPLEIGEYLYRYWKEWQDYQFRLALPTIEEMRETALL